MAKDLSGQQVGMSPANDVNNPRPNIPRGYNQFPQSYTHLTTEQYGLYSPFYWAKCERGDIQNLHSEHDLHSFTMQSPFVGKLTKTKSYIKVPMQAIYPNCWNLMLPIPTQGDDVPADTRALFDVTTFVRSLVDALLDSTVFSNNIFKQIALLEAVASHGSLFEKFNIHFDFKFSMDSNNAVSRSIDYWLDTLIYPGIIEFAKDNFFFVPTFYDDTLILVKDADDEDNRLPDHRYISPSRFLELLRSGEIQTSDSWENFDMRIFENLRLDSGYVSYSDDGSTVNFINIEPIVAYQLACAQFATNDFVDFVYSADLYRKNMLSLVNSVSGLSIFDYNGTNVFYDFASLNYLEGMRDFSTPEALDYWLNLFSFVPSLRYGDYFTGGKPQPLAVGEYTAAVNNNEVSAIDITRSIQIQRLLHRVNMVGRKLGDYLSGIFGGRLPEAEKDVPVFLAHQLFDVEGFETNNTGDAQLNPEVNNIITTNLRSTKDKFAFEVTIDEPCYIIGMSSYAMQRVYSKSVDRFAFHHDRYDDFIPEMQYIGDQSIYAKELDANFTVNLASDYPFAYTLRFMEYKQRYSYASGGFVENLPSWSFITDNRDGNPASQMITPEYIRSSPSEFDRFYKSLTGYSLGSRFHFIVAYKNYTSPLRRMEYTPEILK